MNNIIKNENMHNIIKNENMHCIGTNIIKQTMTGADKQEQTQNALSYMAQVSSLFSRHNKNK